MALVTSCARGISRSLCVAFKDMLCRWMRRIVHFM